MIKCTFESFIHYLHPPQDYVLPQTHSCYELVFYKEGSGRTIVNDDVYDYGNQEMVIIAPHTTHDEKSNVSTEVYCVLFQIEGTDIPSTFIKYRPGFSEKMAIMLDEIRHNYANRDAYFESYINGILQQMIIILLRELNRQGISVDSADHTERFIELSKKLLKEKTHLNADLKVIADNVGYSYDYFRHIFKEKVGMSPKQYQLEQKLLKAKDLLINTTLPIYTIASQCGFGSSSAFNDFFTNKLNITPLKFRKLSQKHVDKVTLI